MRPVSAAAGWPACFVGGAADGGSLPSPVAGSRGGLEWSAEQAGGGGAEGGDGVGRAREKREGGAREKREGRAREKREGSEE